MIWTIWRQHRAEAGVGAAILAALAAAMLVVGTIARDRARALGLPSCVNAHGDCSQSLDALHRDFHTIPPFTATLIAVPLLAGMFWAAPLVSREYEAGTHRLAWTQSVSPRQWITTKIMIIFAVLAAAALALGLLATWTLGPLTAAFGGRYNSTWYDTQGLVPAACMTFALAVGVAASALIRRTIPAMAVTLVAYAAARIPIHWIRWHFAPLSTHTLTVPLSTVLQNPTGAPGELATASLPASAWLRDIRITDPHGHPLNTNVANFSVLRDYCPNLQADPSRTSVLNPGACAARVASLNLYEKITYQPASHFWLIQTVESLIFMGLATLFVTAAILAVTHRRPN
jgi:ABC-type transport system involved in multi-copper enzyme maturation permease subunit